MSFAIQFEMMADKVLNAGALVLLVWAFIDSATRRKEAFPAIGTLPKPGWMIILGLVALLVGFTASYPSPLLMMIGYAAALIYLLDVRRGIRDLAQGSW